MDPHNLAYKRNLFESFLLFRRNSSTRDEERLAALNKLIRQISDREPESEVPLRYRVVQALLDRREAEAVQPLISALLELNRVAGAPHGSITPEQKAELIERARIVIKDLPKGVLEQWRQ